MNWTGKVWGGLIGLFVIGGFKGLIIGAIIGHLYDMGLIQKLLMRWINVGHRQNPIQKIFFSASFMIMGYLAKADGYVTRSEIEAAEQIMRNMGLTESMRQEAIHFFNLGKQSNFDWQNQVRRLRQVCRFHPNLLRTFLQIQLQIVFAEGSITRAKREALRAICIELGLSADIFEKFEHQTRAEYQYRQNPKQDYINPEQHLRDAYEIIGVNEGANNDEIKKAYRRLLSKNHPDKLVAQGLPPEMMKLANEKTQQLKDAYETIRHARGF